MIFELSKSHEIRDDIKHFKHVRIEDYLYKRMTVIGKFIESQERLGRKVYILDFAGALYSIQQDKYNKDYDMFNLGNFGSKGEQRNHRELKKRRQCNNINQKKRI